MKLYWKYIFFLLFCCFLGYFIYKRACNSVSVNCNSHHCNPCDTIENNINSSILNNAQTVIDTQTQTLSTLQAHNNLMKTLTTNLASLQADVSCLALSQTSDETKFADIQQRLQTVESTNNNNFNIVSGSTVLSNKTINITIECISINTTAHLMEYTNTLFIWTSLQKPLTIEKLCGTIALNDYPLTVNENTRISGYIHVYNLDGNQMYTGILFNDNNTIKYRLSNRPIPVLYIEFNAVIEIQMYINV